MKKHIFIRPVAGIVLATLTSVLLLSACGQKGPLTLPTAPENNQQPTEQKSGD